MMRTYTASKFLRQSDILGDLSTSYIKVVEAAGGNNVLVPLDPFLAVFHPGTIAFQANPTLFLGYPNNLGFYVGENLVNFQATSSEIMTVGGWLAHDALSKVANQPLVISLADNTLKGGSLLTASIAAGGSGYDVNDTFTIDTGGTGATGRVVTVNTGVVTSILITAGGANYIPGTSTTTATSGIGTGLTLTIDSVTQGNGQLYVEFDYTIVTIPYPIVQ